MIKTYKFKNKTFETLLIPKGALLFRGLRFEDHNDYHSLFHDLIGYKKDKYYSISPTMNVFFYPVPFASDAVNIYDIHVIYVTQYDIELFLLVKPSYHSRANARYSNDLYKIINTCSAISKTDMCGLEMSDNDPCFTEEFIKRYPQIDGYIAIAEQDASLFFRKYKDLVEQQLAQYVLPSIVSNSREQLGIPEIVLYPLRFRQNECLTIGERFDQPSKIVKYSTKYRSQYSYFPLAYITNNRIYNFTDLSKMENIKEIAASCRTYNTEIPPALYKHIKYILDNMFTNGYKINNIIYKAFVDTKTGFYKLYTTQKRDKTLKRKKEIRSFPNDNFGSYLDTQVNYPNNNITRQILMTHQNYLDSFLNDLYIHGYAPKKRMLLNRGNTNKFIFDYHVNKVIDRPELDTYRTIRKRRNNETKKSIERNTKYMFDFNINNDINMSNVNIVDIENE